MRHHLIHVAKQGKRVVYLKMSHIWLLGVGAGQVRNPEAYPGRLRDPHA